MFSRLLLIGGAAAIHGFKPLPLELLTRLELVTSCLPSRCTTNCATTADVVFIIAPQREVATYSTLGRHLTFLPKHRTSGARWNRLLTKTRFSYFYNPWIGCYFSASRLPRHPGRCLTRWLAWSSHLSNHLTVGLAPSTKIKSRTFFASGETLCLPSEIPRIRWDPGTSASPIRKCRRTTTYSVALPCFMWEGRPQIALLSLSLFSLRQYSPNR